MTAPPIFLVLSPSHSQVPLGNQNRVLTWGIIGAVVMRAIFIALGEVAMDVFHPVLLGFAGVLLFSAYTLLAEGDDGGDEDLTDNKVVAFAANILDATDSYDGDKFFTVVRPLPVFDMNSETTGVYETTWYSVFCSGCTGLDRYSQFDTSVTEADRRPFDVPVVVFYPFGTSDGKNDHNH